MEFPPQKFREIVLQLLFALDMGDSAEGELIPFIMRELAVSKKHAGAAYLKAQAVWDVHADLDLTIGEKSQDYTLERIKGVEKNVLRLALYELLIEKTLTRKIVLAEAYRLARKFSSKEGASFVNAILESLETPHAATLPPPDSSSAE